jgi:glycosyltransferase involved in cell wall biosynthesis
MKSQYERLNSLYHIDKYFNKQLRFCIVVNTYNTGKNGLYLRNLDSILHQNYTNYHVVYTDDASTDQNG